MYGKIVLILCGLCVLTANIHCKYQPNWESLDSRPLPAWYDEAKFGIFIHWGVFSVPSFHTEWFWHEWHYNKTEFVNFMKKNYPPGFTYADFAPMFTAEFYNPDSWAKVLENSGAKYVVLVTKHHEGFTNWPSKASWNWNAMDVGPHRDLVGDLATAVRKHAPNVHFGVYHSMMDWFNPLYLQDKANNFTTQEFVKNKCMPELYELINNYKPDVLWSDGDWETTYKYWNATEFIAWLYNESPVKDTIAINDRWGNDARCKHGGFLNCNDKYNPGVLQKRKWENCMSIDRGSWGYRRDANLEDYYNTSSLVAILAETVSTGGNLLMNIGPTHDGRILPIFQQRLKDMGEWLKVNGEAIYKTRPWSHQNDTITPAVWYTSKPDQGGTINVYAIVLNWPKTNTLILGAPLSTSSTKVSLLGYAGYFSYVPLSQGIRIDIPSIPFNQMPCQWAWVFKIKYLKN
ncbi:unnamed protein product [Owenia fusiformis]|uniref:alpha-L-fucosidase n=1 Tax=Owenia fusiformis TaxID=6347 RepID=A0A8S4QDI4_OWEFU|nr:unnamed protein product [Owenia fusiformis]